MKFSDADLKAAQLARLEEIKAECERDLPTDLVFLMDVAATIGISTVDKLRVAAKRLGIRVYKKHRPETHKPATCVTEDGAAAIIRNHYNK
jgi:hypothetical protein